MEEFLIPMMKAGAGKSPAMGDVPAPDAPCIGKAADQRPIFLNGPNIVRRTRVVALSFSVPVFGSR